MDLYPQSTGGAPRDIKYSDSTLAIQIQRGYVILSDTPSSISFPNKYYKKVLKIITYNVFNRTLYHPRHPLTDQ